MADALGTSFRSLSLSWEGKERRKKNDAYLFLGSKTAVWGTALGRGSILRCVEAELFEMEGMTVANAELGAWNEREREGDCFDGGLKRFKGRQWRGWHGIRERRVWEGEKESLLASPSRPDADKEKFPSQSDDATATLEKKQKTHLSPILRLESSLKNSALLPLGHP